MIQSLLFFTDGKGNGSDSGSDDDSDDDENTEQVTYNYNNSLSTYLALKIENIDIIINVFETKGSIISV